MKVLIAEADNSLRDLIATSLDARGYDVVAACDGAEAWEALWGRDGPPLAILDWAMPGMAGLVVSTRVREACYPAPRYLILASARAHRRDIDRALQAGADDYVVKPFDPEEVRARVRLGERILALRESLARRVKDLEVAFTRLTELKNLLRVCPACGRVRGEWRLRQAAGAALRRHPAAKLGPAVCAACRQTADPSAPVSLSEPSAILSGPPARPGARGPERDGDPGRNGATRTPANQGRWIDAPPIRRRRGTP